MPLTNLLRKDQIKWSLEVQATFDNLKKVMIQASMLAIPEYTKIFTIEVDECGLGLGVVISQ